MKIKTRKRKRQTQQEQEETRRKELELQRQQMITSAQQIDWSKIITITNGTIDKGAILKQVEEAIGGDEDEQLERNKKQKTNNQEEIETDGNNKKKEEESMLVNPPSLEQLLALKDDLLITDAKWEVLCKTFNLGRYANMYRIRRYRSTKNESLGITQSPHQVNILAYLHELVRRNPPSNPTQPILVKFAFDGATMTSGKRIQQEIGTVDLLYHDFALSLAKSPATTHQWLIYIGAEDRQALEEELHDANPTSVVL